MKAELPLMIDDSELIFDPPDHRSARWEVQGQPYDERDGHYEPQDRVVNEIGDQAEKGSPLQHRCADDGSGKKQKP